MNQATEAARPFNPAAFIQAAESLSVSSVDELAVFYSDDCIFTDPFQTVMGRAEVRRVYASMFEHLDAPRFHSVSVAATADRGPVLQWVFEFAVRRGGPRVSIPGISLLELDAAGAVARHTDFWDASLLMQGLPVIGPVVGWLRQRIAKA